MNSGKKKKNKTCLIADITAVHMVIPWSSAPVRLSTITIRSGLIKSQREEDFCNPKQSNITSTTVKNLTVLTLFVNKAGIRTVQRVWNDLTSSA